MQLSYAIIFVADMERSVAFYSDVLGLPVRFETPEWTEYATEGATLALHKADMPASVKAASNPKSPGHCHPGISVADLNALHSKLLNQGVTCVQEPKDLFGARIAQYLDPDGLLISVSEVRE